VSSNRLDVWRFFFSTGRMIGDGKMLNQVTLEGFVVSRWQYKGDAFLRIAHHRPRREGEIIHSDYVTVRVDQQAEALPELQQGDLVRVIGEVRGKDILEPLGRVLQKSRLNVELAPTLENLIVSRPTAYVLARQVSLVDSKEEAYEAVIQAAKPPVRVRAKRTRHPEALPVPKPEKIQANGDNGDGKPEP
jgi:hypothetical protein